MSVSLDTLLDKLRLWFSGEPAHGDESAYATEIVPDEERVIQFLAEFEGMTWQRHITAEFDWSASKTSRVLSKIEADGRITRSRLGRQKAVFLPGQEPDCV